MLATSATLPGWLNANLDSKNAIHDLRFLKRYRTQTRGVPEVKKFEQFSSDGYQMSLAWGAPLQ